STFHYAFLQRHGDTSAASFQRLVAAGACALSYSSKDPKKGGLNETLGLDFLCSPSELRHWRSAGSPCRTRANRLGPARGGRRRRALLSCPQPASAGPLLCRL